MNNMPKITKDELLDAIYHGVYNAIWQVATNNTDMPCADFYDAIKQGTKDAIDGMNGGDHE